MQPATETRQADDDLSACSDGDACTRNDICRAGTCAPGSGTVCGALDQCHAAGVCDPATGACSNPEITCDDGDPCTVDACLPAEGCAHFPASGFSSITCVFGAHGELGVCPGESVPAALTRISGDAQRLIAQAAAAPGGRHAKILLKKAVRKLGSAARLAARAGKRQQVSPSCAGALRGLYLDGKARTETLVRAFMMRRKRLLRDREFGGLRIISPEGSRDGRQLDDFLYKNHIPHRYIEAKSSRRTSCSAGRRRCDVAWASRRPGRAACRTCSPPPARARQRECPLPHRARARGASLGVVLVSPVIVHEVTPPGPLHPSGGLVAMGEARRAPPRAPHRPRCIATRLAHLAVLAREPGSISCPSVPASHPVTS